MQRPCRWVKADRGQRGVFAIVAGLLMTGLLILGLTVMQFGFLVVNTKEARTAIDSTAVGCGYQMLVNPGPSYAPKAGTKGARVDTTLLTKFNNQGDATIGVCQFQSGSINNSSNVDGYFPASATMTGKFVSSPSYLTSALTSLTGTKTSTETTIISKVEVNQIQAWAFNVARARAVFLLDYSRSMRLPYANKPNNSEYAAINQVRANVTRVLSDMAPQMNFGVRIFGQSLQTGYSVDPLLATKDPAPTYQDYTANGQTIHQNVLDAGTSGNGTDLRAPVLDTMSLLSSDVTSSPIVGAPILIIISDGEPDYYPGGNCSSDYSSCVDTASSYARSAITQLWNSNKLGPINAETFSLLIERENKEGTGSQAEQFMQSIAGTKNSANGNPNNYMADGGEPAKMADFLEKIPIKDYCYTDVLTSSPYNVPKDHLPLPSDYITGWFSLGQTGSADQNPTEDVYPIVQSTTIDDFLNGMTVYPHIDAKNPANPIPDDLKVGIERYGRFYYDSTSQRVWLNPWLCFAYTFLVTQPGNIDARFRMRWGTPQLVPAINK